MARELVIAVDCDDVLVPTAEVILREYNSRYSTDVSLDAFYEANHTWGAVSREEAIQRVDVLLKAGITDEIAPDPSTVAAISHLSPSGHELHLVTGRQSYLEPATHRLLDGHFPGIFTSVEHTNYIAASDSVAHRRTKGEVCRAIGAHVLIDDHVTHGTSVLADGIGNVIVFGDYPWNSREQLVAGMARCASWLEVLEEIDRLASA